MSLSRYLLVGITGLSMNLLGADSSTNMPAPMNPPAEESTSDSQEPRNSKASTKPVQTQEIPKTDSALSDASRSSPIPVIKTQSGSISRPSAVKYVQTSGSRVRMRVAPQLDAPVVRELDKAIPLEVTGETDEFYAVRPPYPLKAYVFRTYILDDKIEGDRVNVRLEPSPQGTIVTQLSSGAPAVGIPSTKNPKWLEIDLPPSVRFYISRDYASVIDAAKYHELSKELDKQRQKEQSLPFTVSLPNIPSETKAPEASAPKPALNKWEQKEIDLQTKWLKEHEGLTNEDYATYQISQAKVIQGQLELYAAPSYAPGDFIICQGERIVAIVYSSKVNLMNYKDANVTVQAAPRDKQGFAYPTYCVLSIERTPE